MAAFYSPSLRTYSTKGWRRRGLRKLLRTTVYITYYYSITSIFSWAPAGNALRNNQLMSFFKKMWGDANNSSAQQQETPSQNSSHVAQSMFQLNKAPGVSVPMSQDLESLQPPKPQPQSKPTKGLFSNMKIKKQNAEEKKDMVESVQTNQTVVKDQGQQDKNEPVFYQPPSIPKSVFEPEEPGYVRVVEDVQPPFSKRKSSKGKGDNVQIESGATRMTPNIPVTLKKRNSSASKAQSQQSMGKAAKIDNKQSKGPTRSLTVSGGLAKSSSKSSLQNANDKQGKAPRKEADKVDQVRQIQEEMLKAKERIVQRMKHQKEVKNQIVSQSELLVVLKDSQNEAVRNQNAAVQSEQYDKAAELQQELANLKEKLANTELQLEQLEKDFIDTESNICNQYVKEEEDTALLRKRLVRAKVEAEKSYDTVVKVETEKIELQRGKIERDRKKLVSLQNQISFNQQKIRQLQHQYQQDLNNQTKVLKEHKDDLSRRRYQISEQIVELQKRLQQKKQELSQTQGQLQMADSNISEIKSGFQNEYRKIVQRKDKLCEMEIEKEESKASLDQLGAFTDQQVRNLDSHLNSLRQNIIFITEQCEEYQDGSTAFKDKLVRRQEAFQNFLAQTRIFKEYQKCLRVKQDKVKQIEFRKSSLALEASLLQGKKKELRERIPQLESEKLVLVSNKNFKGAQLKSTQIKEANDRLTVLTTQVEGCFEQEKKVDKLYEEAQSLVEEDSETGTQLNHDLARCQYELETIRLQSLVGEREALLKYPSAEKNQLLAFVSSQIEQLSQELQFLVSQYGLDSKQDQGAQEQSPEKQVLEESEIQQTQNPNHDQSKPLNEPQSQEVVPLLDNNTNEHPGKQGTDGSEVQEDQVYETSSNNDKSEEQVPENLDHEGYHPPSF